MKKVIKSKPKKAAKKSPRSARPLGASGIHDGVQNSQATLTEEKQYTASLTQPLPNYGKMVRVPSNDWFRGFNNGVFEGFLSGIAIMFVVDVLLLVAVARGWF